MANGYAPEDVIVVHDTKWPPETYRHHIEECTERIHYHFTCYVNASDRLNAAHHLLELHDAVGDLATWHRKYDYHTGTMEWQRED